MRHALLTLLIIALPAAQPALAGSRHRSAKAVKAAPAGVHVVRKGETAGKIALANGLSLGELQRLNPGRNLAKLSLGTRLRLAEKPRLRRASRPGRKPAPAPIRSSSPRARHSTPWPRPMASPPTS